MSDTTSPERRVVGPTTRRTKARWFPVAALVVLAFILAACSGTDTGGTPDSADGDSDPDACAGAEDQDECRDAAAVQAVLTAMESDAVAEIDGSDVYRMRCASCHGSSGAGGIGPALSGIADRMTPEEHVDIVVRGEGQMPAFAVQLSPEEIAAVVLFERTELTG